MSRGRESIFFGIALVCLDVCVALIIVAWDLIEQLFARILVSLVSGVHHLRVGLPRFLAHFSALFRGTNEISPLREVRYAPSAKPKE